MRIISTVPSITELLSDLNLEKEVVGITKFCIYPQSWYRTKIRVGGTKTINIETVRSLKPDLIIANREENVKEQIENLGSFSEIILTDIKSPADNLRLIEDLGERLDRRLQAIKLYDELALVHKNLTYENTLRAVYLIWNDPYMTVGGDTYISKMMSLMGLDNVFKDSIRYPEVNVNLLKEYNPDVILLSSEPFPFKQKHADILANKISDSLILCVDGEAFSWYGTRLIRSEYYMMKLGHRLRSHFDMG